MVLEQKRILQSDPYRKNDNKENGIKNVYWGEVINIDDVTQGGRIKVRIANLDNQIPNENLVDCYPLLPRFFHIFPKVGEVVRIVLEDVRYPQRSRFWIGSVISQPQKINFDNVYSSLSTTNLAVSAPEDAPSTNPEAAGVYPNLADVAVLGRNNTDIILRDNDLEIRAGEHELNDNLTLNTRNPASIRLVFDEVTGNTQTRSSNMIMADKIALISHDGIPKFPFGQLTKEDRDRIFSQGRPRS